MKSMNRICLNYDSQQDADFLVAILVAGSLAFAMHNRKHLRHVERAVLSPRSVKNAQLHLGSEMLELLTQAVEVEDICDLVPAQADDKIQSMLTRALGLAARAAVESRDAEGVYFEPASSIT